MQRLNVDIEAAGLRQAIDELVRSGMTPEEVKSVKKVAHSLLDAIQARLVLDWRDKLQSRAVMLELNRSTLDDGLPDGYTKE